MWVSITCAPRLRASACTSARVCAVSTASGPARLHALAVVDARRRIEDDAVAGLESGADPGLAAVAPAQVHRLQPGAPILDAEHAHAAVADREQGPHRR